jgi:hypothetical protein
LGWRKEFINSRSRVINQKASDCPPDFPPQEPGWQEAWVSAVKEYESEGLKPKSKDIYWVPVPKPHPRTYRIPQIHHFWINLGAPSINGFLRAGLLGVSTLKDTQHGP